MRTMLVVEDDEAHLELTLTTIEQSGHSHNIVVARNGQEALDYLFCEGAHKLRDPADQPELVLLDLGLPVMNGLQVMQKMRADTRTFFVPIVMLTSADERSPEILAFNGGLNSYIRKPMMFRDFDAKLEQVRDYWRRSNMAPLTTNFGTIS